jgi:hypothetical protein
MASRRISASCVFAFPGIRCGSRTWTFSCRTPHPGLRHHRPAGLEPRQAPCVSVMAPTEQQAEDSLYFRATRDGQPPDASASASRRSFSSGENRRRRFNGSLAPLTGAAYGVFFSAGFSFS